MSMAFPNGVNHTVYILKGHVKVNGKADLARVSVHGSRVVFLLVASICVCRKHGQGLKVDIGGNALTLEPPHKRIALVLRKSGKSNGV